MTLKVAIRARLCCYIVPSRKKIIVLWKYDADLKCFVLFAGKKQFCRRHMTMRRWKYYLLVSFSVAWRDGSLSCKCTMTNQFTKSLIGRRPEPVESSPHLSYFTNINFNMNLSGMLRFLNFFLGFPIKILPSFLKWLLHVPLPTMLLLFTPSTQQWKLKERYNFISGERNWEQTTKHICCC